jgi:hypothetical protein
MMRFVMVFLGAVLLTGCESCCNSVDVVDSRVAIALDVRTAFEQGSEPLAAVLEEHNLTVVQFEDLMAEIAEDESLSVQYSRAVRVAEAEAE